MSTSRTRPRAAAAYRRAANSRLAAFALSTLLTAASARSAAAQSPSAATPSPQPSIQLPPALDRVLRDYEAAWAARDATGLAALFDDDGFVLSGGRPPVRGRSAIESHYRGAGGTLRLRAIAYHAEATAAWIIGMYGNAMGADSGKFVLALRRADATGPWLIAADMDNPNIR